MNTDLFTTLEEARQHVSSNSAIGLNCPCCGQFYKTWRKKPISTAIAALCRLVSLQLIDDDYYHLDKFNIVPKDRNFNQLVLWDLIEPKPDNEDKTKRASGYWKATAKGISFAKCETKIPKYVYTLDNNIIGFSGDEINVKTALTLKFDYNELMDENYIVCEKY